MQRLCRLRLHRQLKKARPSKAQAAMKAIAITQPGGPEVLQMIDCAAPQAGPVNV